MTYRGVVRNRSVELPPGTDIPDGTVVIIEPASHRRFADLRELAGTWAGDDADKVLGEIYAARSSRADGVSFD